MLAVKSNKVKIFDLPFSAFTCVKPNEQSFGLIMATDAGYFWLTQLIRLNRISKFFAGRAVEKSVLGTFI